MHLESATLNLSTQVPEVETVIPHTKSERSPLVLLKR